MVEESLVSLTEDQRNALCAIAKESWRISRVFNRMTQKLDAGELKRYKNQISYFTKELDKNIQEFGLRIVNIEGQLYDPGMAASPINIDEFEPEDQLMVSQMLDPIIMSNNGIIKTGTVFLGRIKQ